MTTGVDRRGARRRRAVPQDVVTVHIRDNVFDAAIAERRAGHDGALGQRRAQHAQRHARRTAAAFGSRRSEARPVVRAHVRRRRHVRVLLHAPRHADRAASTRELGIGDDAAAHAGAAGRWRATRRHRVPRVGPHDPRPRATRRPSRPASTRPAPGDLVLVSPGVYRESVTVDDRRHRDPRRRSQPHHPRRRVQARQRRDRRRRRRRRGREHDRAQLHRERLLLDRRARLPRLVPHRVPQRRLRRLRVRLAVRAVRPLVRVGQPRRRLLHRPVQPVPRGHHRRRRPSTTSSATRARTRRATCHRELGVVATTAPASCPTASTARSSRPRVTATIAGNSVEDNGDADATTGNEGFDAAVRRWASWSSAARGTWSRRTASWTTPRSASRSRRRRARRQLYVSTGNQVTTTWCSVRASPTSGSSRATPTTELLLGQHVHDVGARRHRTGDAVHRRRHR